MRWFGRKILLIALIAGAVTFMAGRVAGFAGRAFEGRYGPGVEARAPERAEQPRPATQERGGPAAPRFEEGRGRFEENRGPGRFDEGRGGPSRFEENHGSGRFDEGRGHGYGPQQGRGGHHGWRHGFMGPIGFLLFGWPTRLAMFLLLGALIWRAYATRQRDITPPPPPTPGGPQAV